MKTEINRTFEIRGKKTATLKALRNEGFSISQNTFLYHEGNFSGGKAEMIADLCKTGRLVCTHKTIGVKSFDKYYKGRLKDLFKKVQQSRSDYARKLAESYHENVRSLYTSERASVMVQHNQFNESLLECKDYNAYSKNYGFPAKWKDAAVVIRDNEFDIYTSRGTKMATYTIPHWKEIPKRKFGGMLVGGEIYAIELRHSVFGRYNKKEKFTGYAVRLIHPETGKSYFEHGATIGEIKTEYKNKVQIAEKKKLAKEKSAATVRAKSLILRIVKNAKVTYDDARQVGYCKAGIEGFCNKTGVQFSEKASVSFAFLNRYPETQRLRESVAEKLAHVIVK